MSEELPDKMVNRSQLKRLWGVSRQRVHQIIQDGNLIENEDKMISARQAMAHRAFVLDKTLVEMWMRDPSGEADKILPEEAGSEQKQPESDQSNVGAVSTQLLEARRRKMQVDADKKEFEFQRDQGLWMPKAQVEADAEDATRRFVQILTALPPTLAPLCAADGTISGIEQILSDYIAKSLKQIEQGYKDIAA